MGVNLSDGSLDFVSRLDNSDFQSKSLEDIRLIKLRLELTGDISGITKYDEAVKNALATETKLRADLAKILEDARIKTNEFAAEVQASSNKKTIFSDSAAEVQAYIASLGDLDGVTFVGTGTQKLIQETSEALSELVAKEAEVTAAFEAGNITQAEYAEFIQKSRTEQAGLIEESTRLVAVTEQQTAATIKGGEATEAQIGIIENLKISLKELQASNLKITDPEELAKSNFQIQELQGELTKAGNAGKIGFDSMGNAIEQTVEKQSKFSAAISRVTDLSNLGARAVTQLSRQIIGLGVGMLSFVVGAKAIEFVTEWVTNLDIFTGRLDQAKQNLIAFDEVMADADKSAGSQIATLKLLYGAATDVNTSMEKRIEAAQQLREQFPADFANTTNLAIVNGQLKDSYNDVADSIINVARARAAQKKIGDLESSILDQKYLIDKNNLEKANNLQNSNPNSLTPGRGSGRGGLVNQSSQQTLGQVIKEQTDEKNLLPSQTIAIAQGQIDNLVQYVGRVTKTATALADANKLLGPNLENFDSLVAKAQSKADLDNIQSALQTKLKALDPGDTKDITAYGDKLRQIEALEKQYSPKLNDGKAAANADAQSLKNKLALLAQIAQAVETVNRKGLDADQASLKAISDKFADLRNKIALFNSDPKNVNHKIGQDVVDGLNSDETTALTNQNTTNQTNNLKQQLEENKKLYADYEAYKEKAGSTAADAEYSDLLKQGKSFQDYINNISKYVDSSDDSGPMQARADMIQKFQDENNEVQKKAFDALLLQTLTYQQKREALIATGLENEKKLRAAGDNDQANQEAKNTQDALTALDEANFKTLDSYKALFDGIANLTRKQTQDNIDSLYGVAAGRLAEGKISLEAYFSLIKQLNAAQLALKNSGTPQTLSEIGSAFGEIGGEISKVNGTLGGLVSLAGTSLTSLSKISTLANQLQDSSISDADKLKDQVSLIGTAVTGVVSLISSITTASAERKAAAEAYYESILASQNQYNISLDDQIRLQAQLDGNIFYKDTKADILDAATALAQENKQFEASIAKLSAQGQAKVGTKSVVDGATVGKDAATGAVTGAAIGSLFSPVGTLIGAGVGAVAGAIVGLFSKKPKDVLAPIFSAYPALLTKDKGGVDQFNENLAKT